MRPAVAVLVGVLVVGAAVPVAAGDESSPPLADAGLDQRVVVGETVLLDGSGSRDPDGRVAAVEWRIETPDGTTRTPACPDCPRTWFAPDRPGVYEVTLAVTGEGGVRRTDHLRVVVEANSRPEVTVSGPSQVRPGEEATYTASVTSGNSLRTVVWTADGRGFARTRLSGNRATTDASIAFESAGRDTVRATAYDVDGDAGADSVETSVSIAQSRQRDAGGDGESDWDGSIGGRAPSGSSDADADGATSQQPTPSDDTSMDLDLSQPARRSEWTDGPEPSEPDDGGLVEIATDAILGAARVAADAMLV